MKPAQWGFISFILFILGIFFISIASLLANNVYEEHVDYTLPFHPIVRDYIFRAGGKYGLVTLFLILTGGVLSFVGPISGIYACYEYLREKKEKTKTEEPSAQVVAICPKCKTRISVDSKFCPTCGADLRPKRK